MSDDITNKVLLEHIQGIKNDLQQQITNLSQKIDHLSQKMDKGFEEARQHRQALQYRTTEIPV